MKLVHSPSDRRRRGTALLLVVVMGTLAMALWAASYRATHDSFSVERFYQMRLDRDALTGTVLAEAGNLLRTGYPPKNGYTCISKTVTSEGPKYAKVVFQRHGAQDTWRVDVTEASKSDLLKYPDMPDSFASKGGKKDDKKDKGGKKDDEKDKGGKKDDKKDDEKDKGGKGGGKKG
ncbi:MAG: hypothetical protein ISR76_09495 [Planctomycetes bacterium]|nr:hypothetical protein [Planctomycetota bacterium]MBL7009220.1 hypothetical protein [Planctomycetota bacterium]